MAGLGLAACATNGSAGATATSTEALVLYRTPTPSTTVQNLAEITPVLPTATPVVYAIVQGDTLFSIAARNDITVQVLMAANPNVDPLLLSPGTELIIPAPGEEGASAIPSPTPVPALLGEVTCFSSALGELWCFLPVSNTNPTAIESLTGVIQLFSAQGEALVSLEAVPPLNVLAAGEDLPLVAYAATPPAGWAQARGQLLSAYALPANNEIYLDMELANVDIEIAKSGLSAEISGQAQIASEQSAGELWVLAVAYDAQGGVVGVRRWESAGEMDFDFDVYSLGPQITEVKLLVEARP
jgi:LysM repeat protein